MAEDIEKAPRFSILLPTHNRPEVLRYAIESALAQSLPDFELLVVGDGCTDDTAQLVESFDDPRIRWFDFPKAPGFGYANRNRALREAKGELVAFLGHDNLLFADHLQRFDVLFRDPKCEFAHCLPLWIRDDGVILPSFANLKVPQVRTRFLRCHNLFPANCIVHRRSCLEEVGYWPEDLPERGDHELWKRIVTHYPPQSVRYLRIPTCLHFRADWRDPTHWAPMPIPYLEALHDANRFPPQGPRLELTGESLPQAQAWDILRKGGHRQLARLREAVATLRDMLAYHAGMDNNFGI